ncbi:TonB-dependent receptor [soil metagenome]
MRQLYILVIFCLLSFTTAFSQNGTVAGRVVDVKTNEAIIGANVIIGGTTVGSQTDVEGNFLISNVKPGTYEIIVSSITYKTQSIRDVVVESGKKISLQVTLAEDVAQLEEVIVTATREVTTDVSLIKAIRENKLVVSGISSEQIARLPDRDAAQVMQRVPGVTIVDNRFVLIRGIPERYNQVMINGIIGPSTEIDKRSFSFDLIPAGAVDQMLIYKSGAAELPGDFAGGVIQMITKNPTYDDFISVGLNFGFRTNTTGTDRIESKGSSSDIFGYDNGFRDLPSDFPTTAILQGSNRGSSIRERAGKSLTNNFDYSTKTTPIDASFNFAISRHFNIGKVKFGNLTSLSYSNSYQNYVSEFLRYNEFATVPAQKRFEYKDSFYGNDVRVNLMHNWVINLSDKTKIEWKNLFVQLGENENTIRRGTDFIQRPNDDFQNYAYHYLSRTIYTGQLDGTHILGDGSMKLNWVLGMNYIKRNEPDYRRFRTFRQIGARETTVPFTMQLPPSGNLFETGRFWSDLKDESFSNGVNFEKKFGDFNNDKRVPTFKAGYYFEYKTRNFNARYVNYLYPGFSDPGIGQQLINLPLATIFDPSNIKKQDGFVIEEGTQPQDAYQGTNTLSAGYIGGSIPMGKFDVSLGFRGEYNVQKLNAITNVGPISVNNPIFAALPFSNVAVNLTERSLARFAYSRTVNRPEFRELAPFLYYQFEYEAGLFGSPTLKTAFIDNLDLRWEMYPNPGEAISLGVFYKRFTDPIETYLQITSETPQFYYGNAISAYSRGIELEIRKSLASFGVSRLLRNTSVNINAAWIDSNVDIGTANTNQQQNRPLQGQSPYIINTGLYYTDEENGYSINFAYNVFGPRIFTVGDKLFPSWWEMPRSSLDFQASKKFGKIFEVKLNIQNILNSPFRIYQDNNSDNKIEDAEALIQRYQVGTQYALGLQWKF